MGAVLNGATRFTLVTLHVLYGKKAADRVPELTAIAQWLALWSPHRTHPVERPHVPRADQQVGRLLLGHHLVKSRAEGVEFLLDAGRRAGEVKSRHRAPPGRRGAV